MATLAPTPSPDQARTRQSTIGDQVTWPRSLAEAIASIDQIHRDHRERMARLKDYDGGLPAEVESRAERKMALRERRRLETAMLLGRRIDLMGLLRMQDAQGKPRWTVVNPHRPISEVNGQWIAGGSLHVAMHNFNDYYGSYYKLCPQNTGATSGYLPSGLPPLPEGVRRIARSKWVRDQAKWIGVLYQPQEWTRRHADPALVVEWRGLPDEYHALAIWGQDRSQIEEFVD